MNNNMLKRVVTGGFIIVITVAFFLLKVYVSDYLFDLYVACISLVGTYEMVRAFKQKLTFELSVFILLSDLAGIVAVVFGGINAVFGVYVCLIAILLLLCMLLYHQSAIEKMQTALLCMVYPGIMLLSTLLLNQLGNVSFFALVLLFAISPLADSFAFFVGITFKGKKLCPNISPKKTISGAIGGLIGGAVGGILSYLVFKNTFVYHLSISPYLYFAIVGVVAGALTELGDLTESVIKRNLGLKDMGNVFPGHGGMLDRVDGLMFASILIYFTTVLF